MDTERAKCWDKPLTARQMVRITWRALQFIIIAVVVVAVCFEAAAFCVAALRVWRGDYPG